MLTTAILLLIFSNAVTLRRDKSILFSRIGLSILIYSILLAFNSLYLTYLGRGLGLFGGLFHVTTTTHVLGIFIFRIFLYNILYYRTKHCNI